MRLKTLLPYTLFTVSVALAIPHAVFADTVTIESIERSPGKKLVKQVFQVDLASDRPTKLSWKSSSDRFEVDFHRDDAKPGAKRALRYRVEVDGRDRHIELASSVHLANGKRHVIGRLASKDGKSLELALTVKHD